MTNNSISNQNQINNNSRILVRTTYKWFVAHYSELKELDLINDSIAECFLKLAYIHGVSSKE